MKKVFYFFKNNLKIFIAFLVGAIIFSGVGYVVAATIQSQNVSYTTSTNSSISNVKQAVDDLYQNCSVASKLTYKYWNNNFVGQTFAINGIPTGYGLSGTYDTREELASAYGSFNSNPYYIKTAYYDGIEVFHSSCIWYNNHEFCLNANSNFSSTMLQQKMESALQINMYGCYTQSGETFCLTAKNQYRCSIRNASVHCGIGNGGCFVYSDGSAACGF